MTTALKALGSAAVLSAFLALAARAQDGEVVIEDMGLEEAQASVTLRGGDDAVELANPSVLVLAGPARLQDLLPLLEAVAQKGRPLLIVAEDVEGEALATHVVNRLSGDLKMAAVEAPGTGERRKTLLEEIARITGAKLISEELAKLKKITLDMLGRARKVIVTRQNTTIVGGAGASGDSGGD